MPSSPRLETDLQAIGHYQHDLYEPFVEDGHFIFQLPPQVTQAYDRVIQNFSQHPYEAILIEGLLTNATLGRMLRELNVFQMYHLLKKLRSATRMVQNALLLRAYIYVTLPPCEATHREVFNWIPTVLPLLKAIDTSKSPLLDLLLQDPGLRSEVQRNLESVPVEALISIVPMRGARLASQIALFSGNHASRHPRMLELLSLSLMELERHKMVVNYFPPLWWHLERLITPDMSGLNSDLDATSSKYQRFRTFFITLYDYLAPYNEHALLLSLDMDPFSINSLPSMHKLLICTWMGPLLQRKLITDETLTTSINRAEAVLEDPDIDGTVILNSFELLLRIYQAELPPSPARATVASWIDRAARRALIEYKESRAQGPSTAEVFDLLTRVLRLPECLDIWLDLITEADRQHLTVNVDKVFDWRIVATVVRRLGWAVLRGRHQTRYARVKDPTEQTKLLDYVCTQKQASMTRDHSGTTLWLPKGQRPLSQPQKWTLVRFLLLLHYKVPWWVTPPTLSFRFTAEEELMLETLDRLVVPYLEIRDSTQYHHHFVIRFHGHS